MSEPTWITAAAAVKRLQEWGIANPEVLGVWAQDGLLGARAKVERLGGEVEHDTPTHNAIPRWFWGHLRSDPVMAEWAAGVFEATVDNDEEWGARTIGWHISGVEFDGDQLEPLLSGNPATKAVSLQRGILPASAKRNAQVYEEAAHEAAEIVRAELCSPAKAFAQVASGSHYQTKIAENNINETSVHRYIRNAYDLMYDAAGKPHQN